MLYVNSPSELSSAIPSISDVSILGNGPSLKLVPDSHLDNKNIIGMNRIDKFIIDKELSLYVYIFVTDNIENLTWGEDWFSSLLKCSELSKYTIISKPVLEHLLLEKKEDSKSFFTNNIIVLDCLIEPILFSKRAVSKPSSKFTKTGTSLNLAVQIAMCLSVKSINFFGVDLGWKKTSSSKHSDPNHYHTNYQARIDSGFIENCRMHSVHDRMYFLLKSENITVKNYSPKTIVEVYDVYDFDGRKINEATININRIIGRYLVVVWSESKNLFKKFIVNLLRKSGLRK